MAGKYKYKKRFTGTDAGIVTEVCFRRRRGGRERQSDRSHSKVPGHQTPEKQCSGVVKKKEKHRAASGQMQAKRATRRREVDHKDVRGKSEISTKQGE